MTAPRARPKARAFRVLRAGRVGYRDGLALQQDLAAGRAAGTELDTLVLLEHDPVITLGRGAKQEHLLASPEALAAAGVEVHESDRGGDVTYHGPGQVVAYPIFDLKPDRRDVRRYVRDLEEVMIRVCARWGLSTGRREGCIGCWLDDPPRKIGAVGVHLSRWITTHGLALNVDPDPAHFELIVPCGIHAHGVTSMAREIEPVPGIESVMEAMVAAFAEVFEADVV